MEFVRSYIIVQGCKETLHKGFAKLHKEEFCYSACECDS